MTKIALQPTGTDLRRSFFSGLEPQASDSLLALIKLFRDDPRADKIDLGVGVYRNADGRTPVFGAVKQAESILAESQVSKSYLGPEGDAQFTALLAPMIFGEAIAARAELVGVQTPGGTGALRLAADLVASAGNAPTVWVGTPTWPNHEPILSAAGLRVERYVHFDVGAQEIRFDEIAAALGRAEPGDVALLHGCCHNPTGADLTLAQWRQIAEILAERRILPLIDLAYHGLGDGLEADAAGLRLVIETVGEALVAYSCDKNFGLYRERVGALFAITREADVSAITYGKMLALARANWSMPPDHGAAVVRLILESETLTADWRAELESMRQRLAAVRVNVAAADRRLASLARQKGMFSMLPIAPAAVAELRVTHGIYMAGSGRINVAGLNASNIDRFAAAVAPLL